MANTLKFGNGEWYGKEGTILAYNDENNNYKPLPFEFSRASRGTVINKDGLIETVGSGIPRVDYKDDSNGALLLEPTRSNFILKSDDVLSTYQSQNGSVSDASTPINGFNNSIQIDYNASNSLVYKRDFTPTIGTTYTISCFIQMNDNSAPIHTVDANSGDFTLINNNSFASASDIKTERLGSTNIYRVSSTRTATSTINRFGIIKYSTQSSKGFKVTGFQLEQGSYATSYIPTSGSAVTRVAESCVDAGNSNVFDNDTGVWFIDLERIGIDTGSAMSLRNSSGTEQIRLHFDAPSEQIRFRDGKASYATIGSSISMGAETRKKVALKIDGTTLKVFADGSQVGSNYTRPTAFDIHLMYVSGVAFKLFDTRFYNTALSDSELQALTS